MHTIICELRGKEPISCIPISKNQFLHLCSTRFTNLYPNIASYPAMSLRKGQAALSWFKALFGVQEQAQGAQQLHQCYAMPLLVHYSCSLRYTCKISQNTTHRSHL